MVGVHSGRDRMGEVARLLASEVAALEANPELRKWQIAELGAGFVKALGPWRKKESPYREEEG